MELSSFSSFFEVVIAFVGIYTGFDKFKDLTTNAFLKPISEKINHTLKLVEDNNSKLAVVVNESDPADAQITAATKEFTNNSTEIVQEKIKVLQNNINILCVIEENISKFLYSDIIKHAFEITILVYVYLLILIGLESEILKLKFCIILTINLLGLLLYYAIIAIRIRKFSDKISGFSNNQLPELDNVIISKKRKIIYYFLIFTFFSVSIPIVLDCIAYCHLINFDLDIIYLNNYYKILVILYFLSPFLLYLYFSKNFISSWVFYKPLNNSLSIVYKNIEKTNIEIQPFFKSKDLEPIK